MKWLVEARFRCLVVEADTEEQAIEVAKPLLINRLGVELLPDTKITVQPATPNDVDLHTLPPE